jgi:uncharacterized phage-associated protein
MVRESLHIAADVCIYTNHNLVVEKVTAWVFNPCQKKVGKEYSDFFFVSLKPEALLVC